MKIVVTGGRDYPDRELVFRVLGLLRPDFVAHGACPTGTGVDWHADAWCRANNVPCVPHPADFYPSGSLDRSAGPRRNGEMLRTERPDLVLAFHGGRGTADCVRQAQELGIPVLMVVS